MSNITGARAACGPSLSKKEMPALERHHASGRLPLGHTNVFETALQLCRRFDPILPGEHTNRARDARRANMALELADALYTPHGTLITTSIEKDSEFTGVATRSRSRFVLFAIPVSGDTFLTWQKN